jgi:hypothetical protein
MKIRLSLGEIEDAIASHVALTIGRALSNAKVEFDYEKDDNEVRIVSGASVDIGRGDGFPNETGSPDMREG